MRNLTNFGLGFAVGIALTIGAVAPALAVEAKIYPYHSKENYCPAGLQPITLSGVICCGVPNQHQTYQQVKAHPVTRARHTPARYSASPNCREGEKGCF
ncbi:hypothetical protein ACEWPM_002435 [Roseovarius sp. S4756]|uniref:hypothetical protein n=1 Tax=Roseovarius maritimus TaxID=3342637 RepID=UPI0037295DDB